MWTPFCSYCYLLRVNMKKKKEKTFLAGADTQKDEKQQVLGILYHNIYQTQKLNFH